MLSDHVVLLEFLSLRVVVLLVPDTHKRLPKKKGKNEVEVSQDISALTIFSQQDETSTSTQSLARADIGPLKPYHWFGGDNPSSADNVSGTSLSTMC